MALINCDFFSESLGMSTSICVILPQETRTQIGMSGSKRKEKYPTLYLLHGLSDDNTIWQRRTSIERYVSEMGIAVVMPNAAKSFYTDMEYGENYYTYISKELPEVCRSFFPLSDKREDTFIAGLSMGGYGAFKIALSNPNDFGAAASLSGVVDIAKHTESVLDECMKKLFTSIYGDLDKVRNSENDLLYLVNSLKDSGQPKPMLYQCCGTKDFLYEDNIRFKDFMDKQDFNYTYEEWDGDHEWNFWDKAIQKVLLWLPLNK